MDNDDLDFDNPQSAPHVTGSPTSKAAAKAVQRKLTEQEREVLRTVREHPGITRGQLEDVVDPDLFPTRYLHQSVGARVDALRARGHLRTQGTEAYRGRHQERLYRCAPGSPEHQAELAKRPTPPRELRAKLDRIRKLVDEAMRDNFELQGALTKIRDQTSYRVKNQGS
jgi:hypothetical protein